MLVGVQKHFVQVLMLVGLPGAGQEAQGCEADSPCASSDSPNCPRQEYPGGEAGFGTLTQL